MTDATGLGREVIPSKRSDILDASYSDNSCSTLVDFSRFTMEKKSWFKQSTLWNALFAAI
jgi:hypothetical protein